MSPSNKKKLFATGLVVLLILFIWAIWLFKPKQNNNQLPSPIANSTTPDAQSNAVTTINGSTNIQSAGKGVLPVLPASLEGTDIDCPLQVDKQGQLVLNIAIRHCFDYFFSALGEKTEDQLANDIRQYLNATLPQSALPYALKLLNQYLNYRHAEVPAALQVKSKSPDSLQAILVALKNLRLKYFTPQEVQAFFGEEEAYDQYNINVMRITNDTRLTEKQKDEKIDALMNDLPPALAAKMRESQQYNDLQKKTAEILARGGSAQELYTMRSQIVGPEAADRLAKLDIENDQWKQQLTSYLDARARIKANTPDKTNQEQAITALRNQTFSKPEDRLRAQTYETMRDKGDNHIF